MKFHAIAGLPRSGSTLLCNLLAQNPHFSPSSTSCMPQLLAGMSQFWAQQPEVKSEIHNDPDGTHDRMREAMRGVIRGWYGSEPEFDAEGTVVFDKSRAWGHHAELLADVWPSARIIVCVRDLRDVFASIERQHRKTPAINDSPDPYGRTLYGKADRMFAATGIIGAPLQGIEDMLRRQSNIVAIAYEWLASAPEDALRRLYAAIGEPYYDGHDFGNVENQATDLDALYLNKFPHEGSGAVSPPSDHWGDVVPPDIAQTIMGRFPAYNRAFGYTGA